MRRHIAPCVVVFLLVAAGAAADVNLGQILPKTPPGGELALLGANLDQKKVSDYSVTFKGNADYAVPVEKVEPTRLALRVPANFAPGPYLVFVKVESGAPQFVGQIDIVAAAPQIERLAVISTWTKLIVDGQFDFKMIGDRLCIDRARKYPFCQDMPAAKATVPGTGGEPLTLFLDKERVVMGPCTAASLSRAEPPPRARQEAQPAKAPAPAAAPSTAPDQNEGSASDERPTSEQFRRSLVRQPCYFSESPQALTVHGLDVSDREHGGPHEMAIDIAGLRSNTTGLRVSRVTPRMIKWISLVLLVGVVLAFGFVGTRTPSASGKTGSSSLLSWVLLDPETNTYSLSKVQLLLWTLAIVYGYLYLLLAWVLTQGKLEFPPLPASFSVLLMGAGGTSLAAAALSKVRGPKGAGTPEPSLSDFLSSGGVLAGDRAQFFVWTLIGVGGFVFLVLRQLPEKIQMLPNVPNELLSAMGVSAAVYVLGKTVRLPGPVISSVSTKAAGQTFDLTVDGQTLHEKATISIDGQTVADAKIVPPATPAPNAAAPGMFSQLVVQLPAAGPWTAGDHLLRVSNPDGQFAEIWFAANLPQLTAVAPPPAVAAGQPATLTLAGTDLRPGSSAEWLAPGVSSPASIDAAKVVVQPTSAVITFDPGAAKGLGTLTLVSPHGMRASHQVEVR